MLLESRDLVGTLYKTELKEYKGLDYSRRCFIFPGQGVASTKMGEHLKRDFVEVQKKFEMADALARSLGWAAPSLYLERPIEIAVNELEQTRNLALYTLSLGLFDLIAARLGPPALITGHSFGEFAAFVACGMVDFSEMFQIVAARDRACPPAGQAGIMVAIEADAKALNDFDKYFSIANKNSPTQTVVSLPRKHLGRLLAELKSAGLSDYVLESVPQPYHSHLLEGAASKFQEFLRTQGMQINPPSIPMISSVTGGVLRSSGFSPDLARDLLNRQLTSPTDFILQVRMAVELGCNNFIELSHRSFCAKWVSGILADTPHRITVPMALAKSEQAPAVAKSSKSHDSKITNALNRVIAAITGYSITEIRAESSFREDLSIDSVTTAQIVLEFLADQGKKSDEFKDFPLSDIRTVGNVIDWYQSAAGHNSTKKTSEFSLFTREWEVLPVARVSPSSEAKFHWLNVHDPSAATPVMAGDNLVFFSQGGPFNFQKFLSEMKKFALTWERVRGKFTLAFVVGEESCEETRALSGFFRSLAKEFSSPFTLVELDHFHLERDRGNVETKLVSHPGMTVRMRQAGQEAQRWTAFKPTSGSIATRSSTRRTVIAIGGSSGITKEILKSFQANELKSLFVMGRRQASEVRANLEELRALGLPLEYRSGDSSSRVDLERVLAEAAAPTGTIDLVIHGGGYEFSAPLLQQDQISAIEQMTVKIDTVRHLREFRQQFQIGKVICFSSIAGEFGNAGQTVYAFANMAMAHECERANARGGNFSVIAWPAWNRVGMTEKKEVYSQLTLAGHSFLDVSVGCSLFHQLLAQEHPFRVVCADMP